MSEPATDNREVVDALLALFEIDGVGRQRISGSIHDNYRIQSDDSEFFLKVIDTTEYSEPQLRSQIEFMDHLRREGLPVVETIAGKNGEPLAVSADGAHIGILSRWIEGKTLSKCAEDTPIEQMGELIGRFHVSSARFTPTDPSSIRSWAQVYAPPAGGWLMPFLQRSGFDQQTQTLITECVDLIRFRLLAYPSDRSTWGLLHADFHEENLIDDGSRTWIIDLEDIGWGHFLFDLTWPGILYAKRNGESAEYFKSLIVGYERERPLTQTDRETIPVFHLAAGLGYLEMVDTSPVDNNSPVARKHFDFAINWLRGHLPDAKLDRPVIIRVEQPGDETQIREVTVQAFSASELGHNGEADLIDRLRANCDKFLSLVAVVDDRIVGHILFTPAAIENNTATCHGMGLAPMSVLSDYQQQGVGSRLVEAGLKALREKTCPFVIVLGHAQFYARFGFVPSTEYRVECEFEGVPTEVFRVLMLTPEGQQWKGGIAKYRPEFSEC